MNQSFGLAGANGFHSNVQCGIVQLIVAEGYMASFQIEPYAGSVTIDIPLFAVRNLRRNSLMIFGISIIVNYSQCYM